MATEPQEDAVHFLVLTDVGGNRSYGVVAQYYRPLHVRASASLCFSCGVAHASTRVQARRDRTCSWRCSHRERGRARTTHPKHHWWLFQLLWVPALPPGGWVGLAVPGLLPPRPRMPLAVMSV